MTAPETGPAEAARHDVTVVGAGPAGLSAALAAHTAGLSVVVLEAEKADRERPGSRAIFVHRATLDLLEAVSPGLGDRIAQDGLVWQVKRTLWAGRQVYERRYPLPPIARKAPFVSLPQTQVEARLREACAAAGVEVHHGRRLVGLRPGPNEVEAITEDGERYRSGHVIGADGARSTVRRAIGIALDGGPVSCPFVIADIACEPEQRARWGADARVFHYHHPAVGGRNVLLVPFCGGLRVDLQCRPGEDATPYTDDPAAWLTAVLGTAMHPQVTWVSAYHFRQRVADAFHDASRRVLLVSEAAHQLPPFGARGMNSGIADSTAAVAAIRAGREATDPAEPVEHYTQVRRSAALRNKSAAAAALRHLEASSPLLRARHRLAAEAARLWARPGRWLDTAPYGPRLSVDPHRTY
ncbi:FAD-dependent monooxygenase [Streptomyces sp. NPDC053429]|uniref:FAD-dependent monooxygenase n=1 Tax=Streptomyces sp. NPDC053429 TaxID=3365702 RepID=UPI0037D7E998